MGGAWSGAISLFVILPTGRRKRLIGADTENRTRMVSLEG